MKTTKILNSDISHLRVSSLPTRPTAPSAFGGRGYTAREMKEAFDRLPLYIVERFNSLIEDILSLGDDSLIASIPTGIEEGHTLCDLIEDIKSGHLAEYLSIGENSLVGFATDAELTLDAHTEDISKIYETLAIRDIECGTPKEREAIGL